MAARGSTLGVDTTACPIRTLTPTPAASSRHGKDGERATPSCSSPFLLVFVHIDRTRHCKHCLPSVQFHSRASKVPALECLVTNTPGDNTFIMSSSTLAPHATRPISLYRDAPAHIIDNLLRRTFSTLRTTLISGWCIHHSWKVRLAALPSTETCHAVTAVSPASCLPAQWQRAANAHWLRQERRSFIGCVRRIVAFTNLACSQISYACLVPSFLSPTVTLPHRVLFSSSTYLSVL